MTVVAMWLEPATGYLCAADSRISRGGAVTTDSGPKVMPLHVKTQTFLPDGRGLADHERRTLGFAYAGNTLAATSTFALASALTQDIVLHNGRTEFPSIRSIAEIVRGAADHYVREISGRLWVPGEPLDLYAFSGHVFGYEPTVGLYKNYQVAAHFPLGQLEMIVTEVAVVPGEVFAIGSGAKELVEIVNEQSVPSNGDTPEIRGHIVVALREILSRNKAPGVGGYFQLGAARPSGFSLHPIAMPDESGEAAERATMLGYEIPDFPEADVTIGSLAFAPSLAS